MTAFVTQSVLFLGTSTPGAAGTQSFQLMVSTLTTMFETCGWVNTRAVGELNTASVSPPATVSGSIAGYQVWRFNDELHNSGSAPVFIRIDYGTGSDTFGRSVGFFISAGFTHDGSGTVGTTISGVGNTARLPGVFTVFSTASGTLQTHRLCIVSGADAAMMFAESFAGGAPMFWIERTKDQNGNPTPEGVVVASYNAQTQLYRQYSLEYNKPATQTGIVETAPTWIGSGQASAIVNGDLSVSLLIPMLSYGPGYPSRMVGVIRVNELAAGQTHSIPVYGTSSVYFVSSNTSYPTMISLNRSSLASKVRLMMRQE